MRGNIKFKVGNPDRRNIDARIQDVESEVSDLRHDLFQIRQYLAELEQDRARVKNRHVCAIDLIMTNANRVYSNCGGTGRTRIEALNKAKQTCMHGGSITKGYHFGVAECDIVELDQSAFKALFISRSTWREFLNRPDQTGPYSRLVKTNRIRETRC